MKAEQRNARSCLAVDTPEQIARNSCEFRVRQLVASDSEPETSGVTTDRDLAVAAYTQAVALYDSCVQHAPAAEVIARARKVRGKALQHNERV
jgi:hypothetical protein